MRFFSFIGLLLICKFNAAGQELLHERKISLNAEKSTLLEIINDLGKREGLSFTYGNTIHLDSKITVKLNAVRLSDALDKIFLPKKIRWEIIGDQIVLMASNESRYNVYGIIRDNAAGNPLPYAQVRVLNTSASAISDYDGKFSLANLQAGNYSLAISSFAFKTDTIPFYLKDKSLELAVKLSPAAITLSETIVTSDKIIERASVSEMALSPSQLQWSKGISGDPLNSLTALPGVLGRIDIFGTSNIHIRGGEAFENQFLLDNIKLSFPFYSIGQSVFNPDMLEKAEVLTGGYASNYGQSMSSVFNLTTKAGDYQQFRGNADVSVLNNSALIQGPLIKNKLSFILGLRKNNLDLLNLNQHSKAFFMGDATSKLCYIINPKTKISLTTINVVDNLDFTHSPDYRLKLRANNSINAQNLQLQSILGKKNYSKTSFLHSGLNTSSKFGTYYYNTNNNTFGFREDLTCYLNPQSKIKTGAELNIEDDRLNVSDYYRATDISITDTAHLLLRYNLNTRNTSAAVYAFYDGRFLKRFLLNVGGRIDYSQLNTTYDFSPRVTLAYELTRSTTLAGSWGIFNQSPVLYQINQNKNLKSNRCEHNILSIKQNLIGGFELKAEAYYKRYENLVMFNKNLNFVNDGNGRAQGIELTLKKERGNFSGWLSYALSKSERRRNLQDLAYPFFFDQRNAYNAVLNYTRGQAGKNWIFPYSYTLDFRYASGTPYTPVVGLDTLSGNNLLIAGAINSVRNPSFNNFNLKIVWLLNAGKQNQHSIYFYLDVWNVFSIKNVVVRQYVVNTENETVAARNNYAARFYPNFGLKIDFNSKKR
jgi:outer membrane receptor protein involved in Fe transport